MTLRPLTIVVEPTDANGFKPTELKIDRAVEALKKGDKEGAKRIALSVAGQTEMAAIDGARVANILSVLEESEAAAEIQARTEAGIEAANPTGSDNFDLVFDCAHTLSEWNHVGAAILAIKHALKLKPEDARLGMPLLTFLLQDNKPDEAIEAWLPVLTAIQGQSIGTGQSSDGMWAVLIRALGYFGFPDHAAQVVEKAREHWLGDIADLEKLGARVKGGDQDNASLTDAISEFDSFAKIYDENLEGIGNRGPLLVGRMIEELGWPTDGSKTILDAGCGTGLCGPILRPYASLLHGCDLSIPMLERSKARQIFDLLTRTDLSSLITYPEGTFDVVVAADVFVYFGDLTDVLKNLSTKLKPGGWLLFSVEDASRYGPKRGWEKHPSGRFRHMPDHVVKSLHAAGYAKPKLQISDTLRKEFGVPVPGLCIATQKLSLVFAR